MPESTQLAVVGAGPAGLAAARQAAELGLEVTLIDERPGRQDVPPGAQLLAETTAWGIFDGTALALRGPTVCSLLRAQAIVLATGAYDRPFAFPGCTLPGVSAVSELAPLPGRRVVLVGTGPQLSSAERRQREAGADVAAVVEGVLVRVERDGSALSAVVALLGPDGTALLGEAHRLAADAIGVAYGLLPATELLRQAGGRVEYSEEAEAWLPVRSASLEALPGLFVAGDAAGARGERIAEAEGRASAVEAARTLGVLSDAEAARRLEASDPPPAESYHAALSPIACVTPETVVCACEGVTAGQVAVALDEGARTTRELRSYTRLGMGRCQGRMCGATAEAMLRERLGPGAPAPEPLSVRPPVKPVPLEALALLVPRPTSAAGRRTDASARPSRPGSAGPLR